MTSQETVQALMDSVQRGDFDKAKTLLSDDFQFKGLVRRPINGKTWLRMSASLKMAFAGLKYNFKVENTDGNVVNTTSQMSGNNRGALDLTGLHMGVISATNKDLPSLIAKNVFRGHLRQRRGRREHPEDEERPERALPDGVLPHDLVPRPALAQDERELGRHREEGPQRPRRPRLPRPRDRPAPEDEPDRDPEEDGADAGGDLPGGEVTERGWVREDAERAVQVRDREEEEPGEDGAEGSHGATSLGGGPSHVPARGVA